MLPCCVILDTELALNMFFCYNSNTCYLHLNLLPVIESDKTLRSCVIIRPPIPELYRMLVQYCYYVCCHLKRRGRARLRQKLFATKHLAKTILGAAAQHELPGTCIPHKKDVSLQFCEVVLALASSFSVV